MEGGGEVEGFPTIIIRALEAAIPLRKKIWQRGPWGL